VKILVTGICGFVGSAVAAGIRKHSPDSEVIGLDNLWRPGSETNRTRLRDLGIKVVHADVRAASDFENLPQVDWVIDAAANASVLAGVDGATSPRQLIEHNLVGTVNVLEYCRRVGAGLILLSTSRVYSIAALNAIELKVENNAFVPRKDNSIPGLTASGISESFSTAAPISLYGSTKLASENLALEYAASFGIPVWINRCGVMAGAGQFGQPAQGIFAWWINRWQKRKPLNYIGFGGLGNQVRDCLHPDDLIALVVKQLAKTPSEKVPALVNLGGGVGNSMSLAQLSEWCGRRFGAHDVGKDLKSRPFDIPWVAMDSGLAARTWSWEVSRDMESILAEIADHAESNPDWLELSEG
jgi:CDP-paratose 2-epimerase